MMILALALSATLAPMSQYGGLEANVGDRFYMDIQVHGELPEEEVCRVMLLDGEPFSTSCGMLTERFARTSWLPTLKDYMLRKPHPRQPREFGGIDEVVPGGEDMGADETDDPRVVISMRVYMAKYDAGALVPDRNAFLTEAKMKPLRLACRECAW